MASNRVYTESVVTLNNQEATARLDEIRKKTLEVRQEMWRLGQEKGINSKEFKAAQKEMLSLTKAEKDLNEETRKFEKVIRNLNGSSLNELQSAMRKLQQQMRRAKPNTPEFEAYSKKLKEVRTRMRELEDQGRKSQKVLGGILGKLGITASLTGLIALFKKFGSDMVAQTQLVGDKWRFEVAGWKAAYGSFVADLSSGKGWKELVSRMRETYKNGKEVAAMLDEIFERNNSLTLTTAEQNLEAERQRKIMMDSTRSTQERIAAAEEFDRLQQQIATDTREVAAQEEEAYKSRLQQRTEMSDAELEAFVRDYNDNLELIHQAQAYQKEYAAMQARVDGLHQTMVAGQGLAYDRYKESYESAREALDDFEAQTDEAVKRWAGMIDKYNLGNDEMVKNYVQAQAKRINADTSYERATQRSARQASTLRKQLAQEAAQAAAKAYQDEIKKSEDRYAALQLQAKESYAAGKISEKEYQTTLKNLEEQGLRDRIGIAERFKQSTVAMQSQLLDLSIKERQAIEAVFTGTAKEAAAALQQTLDECEKEIADSLEADLREIEDQWDALVTASLDVRSGLDPLGALKAELDSELAALSDMHAAGLLSEEEYQKARARTMEEYQKAITEAQLDSYRKGVEGAQGYIEQLSSFLTSLQDAASARLEARMQAELSAAGDNAEKREAIEADYEQKKLDLQKRYANVNMGIEIAKAIAAGALAVMQGFAELGPVGGAVSAALIAATTAAQVATIVAQRNAIMASSVSSTGSSSSGGNRIADGYSSGGYTAQAPNDYTPVGVVHANEWVAPAAMVRANPVVFASLEAQRRSGNYRSGLPGFADGGSTTPGAVTAAANVAAPDNELLRRTCELLTELKESLPLPAYVVLSQANAKQELSNLIKSITGKKA